jgi:enterochelin esterase-like enzyme
VVPRPARSFPCRRAGRAHTGANRHACPARAAAAAHRLQPAPRLPGTVTGVLAHPAAPLESRWLAAAFLATGLAVGAAWAWRVRQRRWRGVAVAHHRPGTAAAAAAMGVPLLCGALVLVNAYVGYLPTLSSLLGRLPTPIAAQPSRLLAARGTPGVASVQQLTIPADPALAIPALPAVVYLPPGYGAAQRRYPVLYLIHGHPGRAVDWFDGGEAAQAMTTLLADHLIQPMIVVSPSAATSFASDSECLNAVGGPQFETYLTRDVVGFIDQHYRTVRQASGRAIGGMSSGGYCALNLGLHHQGEFSVILAHEPYGTPGSSARWRLLGGSQALYGANCPIGYLPTMVFHHRLTVFLDAPAHGGSLSDTLQVAHQLAVRGQLVYLRVARGVGHTWLEARLELPYSLLVASQHLRAGGAPLA